MAEKILIAEDNPRNMRLMLMALRKYGYSLLEASDGEKALQIASIEKPALIIVDLGLPRINGLEVTRKLRRMPGLSPVPIIAVTAYAMPEDRERAMAAGCDDYVSKPIDTRRFPEMIAEMLSRRR